MPTITQSEILSQKILALSYKQPYAAMMLHGKAETRTWNTTYRGLVLLCASQKPYSVQETINIAGQHQFDRIQTALRGHHQEAYIMQQAFAIGRIVNCRPMTKADEDICYVQYWEPYTTTEKRADGTPYQKLHQLFVHFYADVQAIKPFQWKGTQGWKELKMVEKERIVVANSQ